MPRAGGPRPARPEGIGYVPFFPLGGFSPLQSGVLTAVATQLDATAAA